MFLDLFNVFVAPLFLFARFEVSVIAVLLSVSLTNINFVYTKEPLFSNVVSVIRSSGGRKLSICLNSPVSSMHSSVGGFLMLSTFISTISLGLLSVSLLVVHPSALSSDEGFIGNNAEINE